MESIQVPFDVDASILKHIAMLKPWFPKRAFLSIGDYSARIFLKGTAVVKAEDSQPLFIDTTSRNLYRWSKTLLDEKAVLGLDRDVDPHFWFDATTHINSEEFLTRLRNTSVDKVHEAIIAASTWDGFSSALLPTILAQAKPWKTNFLAVTFLPSKIQPPDAQFNAYSCLAMCASKEFTPLLLLDRDLVESYVGVDRKGAVIKGNAVLDYLFEMILTKNDFVQEVDDLLKPFNARMCAVLAVTGASFKIYGSLENILNTTLVKPLSDVDLSTASLVYVLIRMPAKLKDKLPRGKIELAVAGWFEEKGPLKSIYVAEPLYAEDALDRVDVTLIVSGYDTTKLFATMEKSATAIKNHAVENGFMKKEEWLAFAKGLATR